MTTESVTGPRTGNTHPSPDTVAQTTARELATAGTRPGSSAATLATYDRVMMRTFGLPKRVFVRGEACYVWDAEGRRYLDLLAGIAVNALGHAHPTVLAAITGQISTLGHVSNFFATPAQVALAERLVRLATAGATVGAGKGVAEPEIEARVFFANSGTEANEAAFKLTRLTGRTKIISTEGAFHGRSLGALAITHNPHYREPFEPLPGDVEFIPYGDVEALAAAVDDTVAAVVLEPIQGENGIVVPPPDYLAQARAITARHGALLWIDEVQTGIGRCGEWLVHAADGVVADVVTVAKGLGNGFPIGACVATGRAAELLGAGSHGSTFGGNPVASIAGLAVLNLIERDGLLANARAMGERLADTVTGLGHPLIEQVRGRGLLRGIVFSEPIAAAVSDAALDAGFIVNAPRPTVIRVAPPLIINADQIDSFVSALPDLIDRSVRP